jgi:uncharacterized protein YbjT (DUF2867 family)
MKRILITGATGNVGREVVHFLSEVSSNEEVYAAVRDPERARKSLEKYPRLGFRQFDFEDKSTYSQAFDQVDVLFLLRPPHISNVELVFHPLLSAARKGGIKKVVFLSVQGAEKSKVIPHNKIERLIKDLDFDYIFLRPSYFMQNLTTTLLPEIVAEGRITLPSGGAKFNWIDVVNIGEVAAILIQQFDIYRNQALELTGTENKSFEEVARTLTWVLEKPVEFRSINPISFYFKKRREGVQSGFALVMTLLHFLPRLQPPPVISENYRKLTGKGATTLEEFIEREKSVFAHTNRQPQ